VDSYTLEQLEEIATEAGISPEAVRAAAMEHETSSAGTTAALPVPDAEATGGWLAAVKRRMPAAWSPALKNAVLTATVAALLALVIAIVGVGPIVVVLTAVILVLILLMILLGLGPV
jgi:7-cyano-7-deazaguanine synthase in queuosine biosynthesis